MKCASRVGLFSLLAGVSLFSTVEVASKLVQTGGGNTAGQYPFWLAFFRFFITGVVLCFPACRLLRYRKIALTWHDFLTLSGLGFFGVTLMSSLYHLSLTLLPANIAALVFSCNPVFVVLFAPLVLSEKITRRKLIAVGLALTGIAVLAVDRMEALSLTGFFLMLISIVIFAFYTLLFKKVTPRYGALPITAFAALTGGILILPFAFGFEGIPLAGYGVVDWIGIAYLALAGTALGYFCFIYGIGHVEAGVGSMAFFLKPFLASLFAWMVLGEKLRLSELIGGVIILSAMLIALVPFRQRSG